MLGVAVAVLTASGEAAYFWIAYGADPMMVIAANWSLDTGMRPAVVVLALTEAVAAGGGAAPAGDAAAPSRGRVLPEAIHGREDAGSDRAAFVRELMAVFDELPAPLRDAINYAPEPLDPKALAALCRRHGAGNVLAMIELKLRRAAGR